jgi:hypothetical protein
VAKQLLSRLAASPMPLKHTVAGVLLFSSFYIVAELSTSPTKLVAAEVP